MDMLLSLPGVMVCGQKTNLGYALSQEFDFG